MVDVACKIGGYFTTYISDSRVWHGTPLDVVCNDQFPAPIYGGYLPWTGVYCGAHSRCSKQ